MVFISAQMIGLDTIHGQALSGDQIDSMTEYQLDQVVHNVTVFYRVSPRHKLAIVKVILIAYDICVLCCHLIKIFIAF